MTNNERIGRHIIYKLSWRNKSVTKCVNYNSTLSKDKIERPYRSSLVLHVQRNTPYSLNHPCNVMDIYRLLSMKVKNSSSTNHNQLNSTQVLFVHGGMWMFGSKDDETPSSWIEFLQGLVSLTFMNSNPSSFSSSSLSSTSTWDSIQAIKQNPLFRKREFSNIGATMACHGAQAYIINYRLVHHSLSSQQNISSSTTTTHTGNDDHETKRIQPNQQRRDVNINDHQSIYVEQVMDVARSIAFLIQQEWEKRQQHLASSSSSSSSSSKQTNYQPTIFITGISAGAHLTALALTNMSLLNKALKEMNIDPESIQLEDYIAGYIGFSGPYNLRRLFHSPLADLIIGPAFLGKGFNTMKQYNNQSQQPQDTNNKNQHFSEKDSVDIILSESSPIHVLLSSQQKSQRGGDDNHTTDIPILCKIPLLLINAEDDFHLSQDSKEFLIALNHYPSTKNNNSSSIGNVERLHTIIPSTNHLTLMREFAKIHSVYDYEMIDSNDQEKIIRLSPKMTSTDEPSQGWLSNAFWSNLQQLQSFQILYKNNKKEDSVLIQTVVDFITRVKQRK